jgi:hypothetical protein
MQDSKKQAGTKPSIKPYPAFILSIPLSDFTVLEIKNGTTSVLHPIMIVLHDYTTAIYSTTLGSRSPDGKASLYRINLLIHGKRSEIRRAILKSSLHVLSLYKNGSILGEVIGNAKRCSIAILIFSGS